MAIRKNLKRYKHLFLFFILITLSSCSKKTASSAQVLPGTAVFAIVVDYSELDGCNYLLELSDGQKLQPVNLSEELKRKGLKLFITYKLYDGVGVCMAGRMVTLTSATVAKDDNR